MKINILKVKNIVKLELIVIMQDEYRGVSHSICDLKHNILKEINAMFHYGSNYDYHNLLA